MATRSYALLCPHCSRKLRAHGPVGDWEVRCSLCGGSFSGPPAGLSRRTDVVSPTRPRCRCGTPIEAKPRSEDVLVRCPRCGKWLFVLRDPLLAERRTFETAALMPVRPRPAEKEAPGEDIERARHVVSHLLPTNPPSVPGMDVAVFSQFRDEVGGDYYDFIELPGGRIGIAIADVSGKGVGAAMLMVRLREILHGVAADCPSVAETLVTVNARLAPTTPRGMFVTCLYAVLDPQALELRAANAGHCAPLVWRARLTGVRLLQWRGPALCILPPEAFAKAVSERTLAFEPGDCLCLYTDGVSEAKNPRGEDFGESRIAAALHRHPSSSAQAVVDDLVAALAAHTRSAEQHDDVTLIVLKCLSS